MNNEGTLGAVVGAVIAISAALLWNAIGKGGPSTNSPQVDEKLIDAPTLCIDAVGSKTGVRMLKVGIRKSSSGADETFLLPDPEQKNCAVQNGDVVTWISDTNIGEMSIRFVNDQGTGCALASTGSSINPIQGDTFSAPTSNKLVTPLSVTVDTTKLGNFYYCVMVKLEGSTTPVWTPKPAIIIKPT